MKLSVFEHVEYEDSEDVPVVLASHLGGVYRIGPSTIQVTMVNRLVRADKTIIKAAVHEIWDKQVFLECQRLINFSSDQLERTNTPKALRKAMRKAAPSILAAVRPADMLSSTVISASLNPTPDATRSRREMKSCPCASRRLTWSTYRRNRSR